MKQDEKAVSGMVFNIQKFCVHDGPGIRTVVFFKGCPLRCKWCANPESQSMRPQILDGQRKGEEKTVEEILDVVMQDEVFYEESGGGITLSGGEFLLQPAFAKALLTGAKEKGLHTCGETTGYAAPEVFASVAEHLDCILFDLKHWNGEKHRLGTGVSNLRIIQNMKLAVSMEKDVLPRIPVIPGFNDTAEDAIAFSRLLKEIGIQKCQILPFHQFGENKYHLLDQEYAYENVDPLHREDLSEYLETMHRHGIDAFF